MKDPNSIALFASAFYPSLGGVEELCRHLSLEYQTRGIEVVVITHRWPKDLPERDEVEGVPVLRVPMLLSEGSWRQRLRYKREHGRSMKVIVEELCRRRVGMVHVQCVSGSGLYAHSAAQRLGLPLVVSAQGERTMDATGVYQRSPALNGVLRQLFDEADAVTACSRQTLQDLEEWRGTSLGERGLVVHNGIRVSEFDNARPFDHPRPYVLAIGRHVRQKGFDLLLEAFDAADLGDHDLLVAGDGPERAALGRRALELKKSERVRFVGRANRTLTISLFSGCSFFVLPSRHEPQGIVILEAMVCEKAVAAARVGGVPEVVRDGENGLLFDALRVDEQAAALERLAGDEGLRRRLGGAGRATAARLDWSAIADEYLAVYARASANRGRSAREAGARPTLCMISDDVGRQNAIGRMAAAGVEAANGAGFRVTVLAKRVEPEWWGRVEWLLWRGPRRSFALQGLLAGYFLRRALRGRTFDVVHAHQPQAAGRCDVYQCHFLTREARARGALGTDGHGSSWLARCQQQLLLPLEDAIYSRWCRGIPILFNSHDTRQAFVRAYGRLPASADVLWPPCESWREPTGCDQSNARTGWGIPRGSLVVGFLGGASIRKGLRRILAAVAREDWLGITVLVAGPFLRRSRLLTRTHAGVRVLGLLRGGDIDRFYAACDVVVVPSVYEPFGLVVNEATCRGVPVVVTREVGARAALDAHEIGFVWDPSKPLGPLLWSAAASRNSHRDRRVEYTRALGRELYDSALVAHYRAVLTRSRTAAGASPRGLTTEASR